MRSRRRTRPRRRLPWGDGERMWPKTPIGGLFLPSTRAPRAFRGQNFRLGAFAAPMCADAAAIRLRASGMRQASDLGLFAIRAAERSAPGPVRFRLSCPGARQMAPDWRFCQAERTPGGSRVPGTRRARLVAAPGPAAPPSPSRSGFGLGLRRCGTPDWQKSGFLHGSQAEMVEIGELSLAARPRRGEHRRRSKL